jgi:subtilisin family serine protease
MVVLSLTFVIFSGYAQAVTTFDIDRGSDTGVRGWRDKITQWWNDRFYGYGKVSFDVVRSVNSLSNQGVTQSEVLINIEYNDIKELQYDFPEAECTLIRNVSSTVALYSVTANTEEVIGGFWSGLASRLGFNTASTVSNREYVLNVYSSHTLSLVVPITETASIERLSLKNPDQMGMTTAEIREHYGLNNIRYNGSGVKVAVLDTGIYKTNEYDSYGSNFFALNAVNGENTSIDYNGHGSHVNSILGGTNCTIDGFNFEGMAPGATIYSIRVLNSRGSGSEADIIRGIEMAIDLDVDIISMSLGGSMPAFSAFYDVIQKARTEGIIIVAAAGNDGGALPLSPAIWDGVISIGSLSNTGFISFFSNLNFDVGAIGQDVTAPAYAQKLGKFSWVTMSGTSMATPVASGLLALYIQANPTLKGKVTEILQKIKYSADYTNPEVNDNIFTMATWWNNYYYSFGEFDVVSMLDGRAGVIPTRSSIMTFGSISFWRSTGKQP